MREEKEERERETKRKKKKRNKNKVYRNICRMKFYRWFSLRGEKNWHERTRTKDQTAFSFSIYFCLSLFRFFTTTCFSFFDFPQRTNSFRPETELSGICLSVVNGSSKFSQAKKRGGGGRERRDGKRNSGRRSNGRT